MKKRIAGCVFGASAVLATVGGYATLADAQPAPTTQATVISHVTIDKHDPTVGYVRARYTCQANITHLWVSVKQNATATADPALTAEGSSEISAAWVQSHPENFTCDGKNHVQDFRIDAVFGELMRGVGYVQFCFTDGTFPPSIVVSDMNFQQVK
jgi:hypothetical protein